MKLFSVKRTPEAQDAWITWRIRRDDTKMLVIALPFSLHFDAKYYDCAMDAWEAGWARWYVAIGWNLSDIHGMRYCSRHIIATTVMERRCA